MEIIFIILNIVILYITSAICNTIYNNIIICYRINMCWAVFCREWWVDGWCSSTINTIRTVSWFQERNWISFEPSIVLYHISLMISSGYKIKFFLWKANCSQWHQFFTCFFRTICFDQPRPHVIYNSYNTDIYLRYISWEIFKLNLF